MSWQWVSPVLAFAGAAIGSGLPYIASRLSTRQLERQSRREEWGRRFTAALDAVGDTEPQRRRLGLILLGKLAQSQLASSEERRLAEDVLDEAARYDPRGADLRLVQPGSDLDAIRLVEQNGNTEGEEQP